MEPTIDVTNFIRPYGRREIVTITHVYPDDAKYINENKIKVSMEDCGFDFACWMDYGHEIDGEPDEVTLTSNGRTCEEMIAEGVRQVKLRKELLASK